MDVGTYLNKRFGRLKVLSLARKIKGYTYWHCLCDCGNTRNVRADALRIGATKSCGCLQKEVISRMARTQISPKRLLIQPNQRFERLVVIKLLGEKSSDGHLQWLCICDCGKNRKVQQRCLLSGSTKSCGCFAKDKTIERLRNTNPVQPKVVHGMYGTSEYKAWSSIKQRCLNPNNAQYFGYGGRGIKMCERWKSSFKNFYEDIGDKPSPTRSLDRIDNEGNYSCGKCEECKENGWNANCSWATPWEQAQNRRPNKFITFNNKTLTISEWANEFGVNYNLIWWRLNRKWDVEKAITTPSRNFRRTNGRRRNGTYD
jgi:hypothetical protein